MATLRRKELDDLLAREAPSADDGSGCRDCGVRTVNAVWRQKVVRWYFTLIAALRRRHAAAAAEAEGQETGGDSADTDDNPFDRSSVHVTVALLDDHLSGLPREEAARYERDRPSYQLLATTCLLIGMRLARHDRSPRSPESAKRPVGDDDAATGSPRGMKRAKTHYREHLNEAASPATPGDAEAAVPGAPSRGSASAIPGAAEILRISAAPPSLREKHVLKSVREVVASPSFPKARVVTALDFLEALNLEPSEAEDARRVADVALADARFRSRKASVVACAAVALVLARSDPRSARDIALRAVFGSKQNGALQDEVEVVESDLLASLAGAAPSPRDRRVATPTAHLIPLEDE